MERDQLAAKVRSALERAFEHDPDAIIHLEMVPPGKVGGLVLSASLAPLSPTERQDRIWEFLDQELTPYERTRITFIVTDTPEEHRELTEPEQGKTGGR